jgi:hypothetical protein
MFDNVNWRRAPPLLRPRLARRSFGRHAAGSFRALALQHLARELDDLLLVRRFTDGEKHAVEFQAENAVEGDVLVFNRGFPASDVIGVT